MSARLPCPALFAVLLAVSSHAAGQTDADRVLAQTLFEEGRELMKAERWSEACPKLEESHRLDPLPGVLLNVAVCHEKIGRIATAWTELKEALALARADGRRDRIELAESRIAAIEPRLPRLVIEVDPATRALSGLTVARDGSPVRPVAWDTAVPVDPGEHHVSASAPGWVAWSTLVVAVEAQTSRVTVPALVREPVATPPPLVPTARPLVQPLPRPMPDSAPAPFFTQRRIGFGVAALGVLGILVGSGAGIYALTQEGAASETCSDKTCPDADALAHSDDANGAATVANVAFGVGAVTAAIGAVLVLTSSGPEAAKRTPAGQSRRPSTR